MKHKTVLYTQAVSPIGNLLLTSDGAALTGLYFESHKAKPEWDAEWQRNDAMLEQACKQIALYFEGRIQRFDMDLEVKGTEFQLRVWEALRGIPFGTTVSYSELAQTIGAPRAVRAVGAAVGRNPISIIVPCHRVVGSNGSLTGFAGGLERKRWLLEHERTVSLQVIPSTPDFNQIGRKQCLVPV